MVKVVVLLRQGCKFNLDGLADCAMVAFSIEPSNLRNISTNSNIA